MVVAAAVFAIGLVSHFHVRALEADPDEIAEEWNEMDVVTGALVNETEATRRFKAATGMRVGC